MLSLSCVCAASLSRAAIIDDLRPQPVLAFGVDGHPAIRGAGELSAGARLGISHAERPRAKHTHAWRQYTGLDDRLALLTRTFTYSLTDLLPFIMLFGCRLPEDYLTQNSGVKILLKGL